LAGALPPASWEVEDAGKAWAAKTPSVAWTVPTEEVAGKCSAEGSQADSQPPKGSKRGSKAGSHKTVNLPQQVPDWTTLAAAHGWTPPSETQPSAMYTNMLPMWMPPILPVPYQNPVQQWAAEPSFAPNSQRAAEHQTAAGTRRTSLVPTIPVYDPLQAFPTSRNSDPGPGVIDPLSAFPVPGSLASGPWVIDPMTAFPKPYSLQSYTSSGASKASKTSKVSHISKAQTHYSTGSVVGTNTRAPISATLPPPHSYETQTSHYRPATFESASNTSSAKHHASAKTHVSVGTHRSQTSPRSPRSQSTKIKITRKTETVATQAAPAEVHAAKPPSTKSSKYSNRVSTAPSPPLSDNWRAPSVAVGESAGSVLYDTPIMPAKVPPTKGSQRSKSGRGEKRSSNGTRTSVNEDMRSQAKTEIWNGIPVSVASWREGFRGASEGGQW